MPPPAAPRNAIHAATRTSKVGQRRAALAEHVDDPDPQRRRWCVSGYTQLVEASQPVAVDGLTRLTSDPDPTVRLLAEGALRWATLRGQ